MCNNHDHYVEYSTDSYRYLCFKHAILEALKDVYVETEVQPHVKVTQLYNDCEICEKELSAGMKD